MEALMNELMQSRKNFLERQEEIENEFNEKFQSCLMDLAEELAVMFEVIMYECS